jgi:hypothetical protein
MIPTSTEDSMVQQILALAGFHLSRGFFTKINLK